MTQRVDLATVMDRLAVDEVVTRYAVAVDDGDWTAYRALFTDDGRADYRGAGGVEGPAAEVADWLAETMRPFPVRQHLIVNRRVRLREVDGYPGDRADVQADYVSPMRLESGDGFLAGGRYAFGLARGDDGWRLRSVAVREKWRRAAALRAAE
ncbi:nuclear transport factor 2 family protein [Streptomyces tirandamycinicus]|uniref:nuclear transport factor 2 family protein n=1 Tax=Streptomyces TaxID=1883 RepID=UPI0014803D81|nr:MULTISPECIES: nuclear transport factor 2 family protein [Streptomyces]MCY0979593.1 nuclear transport factor 2 family protein [Streptomyces tirandamycinicus]